MSKKNSQKSNKDVLKLIEQLAELETKYFKKGVVDALKLLYEQDVTMTNVIGERLEEVKGQLETLRGFMLGIHIATLQYVKGGSLSNQEIKEIASLYEIDFDKVKKMINADTLIAVLKKIKKR